MKHCDETNPPEHTGFIFFSMVLPRLRGIFHGCLIFLGQSLHVEFFLGCVALDMAAVACGREAGILLIIFEE